MNLYCIKCLKFAKNNNIKIKREIETFVFILVVLTVILKFLKLLIKK